jgi:invasion protein IalB
MDNQPKIFAMNTRRTLERLLPLAAAIMALTVIPAAAQQADAKPAAAAPAAPAGGAAVAPMQSWVKTCDTNKVSKQELCIVTQDIRADSGLFIASITLRQITGDKKFSLLATVPLGMLLKPGLKMQVDSAAPVSLVYGICDGHSCYGVGDIDESFIASMKGGKTLVLTTYSQDAKPVVFSMPLAGFATALASKGLDPAAFQKFQDARAGEYKAKADQARQALIQQQREQSSGNPAPAQ